MKTTNAKHTALPWRTGRKVARFVYASDETPICECEGMGEASREQEAANASFIVRAVNSHEELIEILKEAHEYISRTDMSEEPFLIKLRAAIHQAQS